MEMLELMKARHSVRQYKEQKKDLEKLRSKKGWRMLPLLLVSLLLVSCKGNEVNIKEVESETTEIYISYAGEIQQFDTNAGLVKNIENLIWLAPRGGLNMELVGEDVSEEYNPYIYESTHLEAEDSSDLIWVKILEDPSDSDKGEGTSEKGQAYRKRKIRLHIFSRKTCISQSKILIYNGSFGN